MGGKLVAVEGAIMVCSCGSTQAPLLATCRTAKFGGAWAANIYDFVPGKNIPSFGNCSKKNAPCTPNTCDPWIPILQTVNLWQPVPNISEGAMLACKEGGIINIIYGGQSSIFMACKTPPVNMCEALPPGMAGGAAGDRSSCGAAANACGADYYGANACGAQATACGAAASGASACGAAASACGAAVSGATACGAAASACGADATAASACGVAASACGANATGASACGVAVGGCGANATGAEACGVATACAADVCGADACGVDLTLFDIGAVDVCAVDVIPIVPFI